MAVLSGALMLLCASLRSMSLGQGTPSRANPAVMVASGPESATDVTADGRTLLLIDWATTELKRRELATGAERQLTFKQPGESGYPGHAAFSPDGQSVAFNWYTNPTLELRLIAVDGGPPRILHSGGDTVMRLQDWAPDGKRLLVVRSSGLEKAGELGVLDVVNSTFTRLAEAQAAATARFSPDGKRIALSQLSTIEPTQRDVHVASVGSGVRTPLATSAADERAADWTPDGRAVTFVSDEGGKPRLWRAPVAGTTFGRAEPLHDLVDGDLTLVGITRDQRALVSAEDIGGSTSHAGRVDWVTGRVSDVRELPNPPFKGSRRAVPSPDGRRVAFLRRGRGFQVRPGWQIPVVQSLDGTSERAYPTALTLRDEPAWSPDGQVLVFAMPPEGAVGESAARHWRFVRLDLRSGEYRDVGGTGEPGLVRMAGLTARSLYYLLSDFSGLDRVKALDWAGGASRTVHTPGRDDGVLADVAVLGDGRRLALATWRGGRRAAVHVVTPGAAGEPTLLGEVEANSRPQLVWSGNGDAVILSGRVAGKQGVWRLPVDGTTPQRLLLEETGITEVRVSGDGTVVAFTRRVPRPNEVWSYPLP